MNNAPLLPHRRALVTGGGTGIGRAIALALSRAGARVVVTDKDEGAAKAVAGEIGSGAVGLRLDVTSADETARVLDRAVAELGGLDILCANAGISTMNWTVDLTE